MVAKCHLNYQRLKLERQKEQKEKLPLHTSGLMTWLFKPKLHVYLPAPPIELLNVQDCDARCPSVQPY